MTKRSWLVAVTVVIECLGIAIQEFPILSTTNFKIILLVYFPALTIDAEKISNNATFDVDLTFDDYEVTNGTNLEENVVYPSGSRSPKKLKGRKKFRSSRRVKMEDTGSLSDKNIVNGKDAKLGMV